MSDDGETKQYEMGHDGDRIMMRCVKCGDTKSFADDEEEGGMGATFMNAHGAAHICFDTGYTR